MQVAAFRRLRLGVALLGLLASACGSSTTTSTAPSTVDRCSVSVRASQTSLPAGGGSGQIDVTTARECSWAATSEADWLTLNGRSTGQGNGSVEYRAAPNGDPVARRGAIVLNNQRTEISQAAAACVVRLRDASVELPPGGGSGTVEIDASSEMCSWTASSEADWITLTSQPNGRGTGTVSFAVAATSGPPRTGTIRVADQRFSVTQGQGCEYTIAPASGSVPAAGGSGTVAVTTAPGCPWTAISNSTWIAISDGASGSGPGTVTFTAAPLEGPARDGMLIIAGHRFDVQQAAGCAYQVQPLAHAVPAPGGTVSVNVQTAAGCAWTAASAVPWITIGGSSSGSGGGSVSLVVAASSGGARSGTVAVAGQTVTITQAQGCSYSIAPESQSVPAGGGTGAVDVTAGGGCTWTAASNVSWITVTEGGSGSGNGTVRFTVAPAQGPARSGTLTIAGRTFTVNQGESCAATLDPPSITIAASGGSRSFDVRSPAGCSWSASPAAPWITIASGATGTGDGTVTVEIQENTGAARKGTVTAAGQTFTVEQQSGCEIALGAAGQSVSELGGEGKVEVITDAGCTWSAATDQPWIAITGGASGTGAGAVVFAVQPNAGPQRTGTIGIGGQTFTIMQAGACSFAIAPQQHDAPASAGTVTVSVTAAAGCSWTASSNAPWIHIVEGASGSGQGGVRVDIDANSGPPRSSPAVIAGQTFVINQANGCTYVLSPDSRNADEDGDKDSFRVTTSSPECTWTAGSTVPWITVLDPGRGTGEGRVNYRVEPNRTGDRRSGTIIVEGQIFTVNQRDDN